MLSVLNVRIAVIWRNLRLASGTRRRKAAKAHL